MLTFHERYVSRTLWLLFVQPDIMWDVCVSVHFEEAVLCDTTETTEEHWTSSEIKAFESWIWCNSDPYGPLLQSRTVRNVPFLSQGNRKEKNKLCVQKWQARYNIGDREVMCRSWYGLNLLLHMLLNMMLITILISIINIVPYYLILNQLKLIISQLIIVLFYWIHTDCILRKNTF